MSFQNIFNTKDEEFISRLYTPNLMSVLKAFSRMANIFGDTFTIKNSKLLERGFFTRSLSGWYRECNKLIELGILTKKAVGRNAAKQTKYTLHRDKFNGFFAHIKELRKEAWEFSTKRLKAAAIDLKKRLVDLLKLSNCDYSKITSSASASKSNIHGSRNNELTNQQNKTTEQKAVSPFKNIKFKIDLLAHERSQDPGLVDALEKLGVDWRSTKNWMCTLGSEVLSTMIYSLSKEQSIRNPGAVLRGRVQKWKNQPPSKQDEEARKAQENNIKIIDPSEQPGRHSNEDVNNDSLNTRSEGLQNLPGSPRNDDLDNTSRDMAGIQEQEPKELSEADRARCDAVRDELLAQSRAEWAAQAEKDKAKELERKKKLQAMEMDLCASSKLC